MSRTPEQRAWDSFKDSIDTSRLKCKRVENAHDDGMSDVIGQNRNGATFWIEIKALDEWPKRASTNPLASKFEPGQIPFMRNWIQWGGHAFVLLRVKQTFFLLNPMLNDLRHMNTDQLIGTRIVMGSGGIIAHLENLK